MKRRSSGGVGDSDPGSNEPLLDILFLATTALPAHKITYMAEMWHSLHLSASPTRDLQMQGLASHYVGLDSNHPYRLSQESLASVFGLSKSTFQDRCKMARERDPGTPRKPPGRLGWRNFIDLDMVKAEIGRKEELRDPMEPMQLLDYINRHFGKTWSKSWIYRFLNQAPGLYEVDAAPLEKARAEVTDGNLRQWAVRFNADVGDIPPDLLFNFDETSEQPRTKPKSKKVVSLTNAPTVFAEPVAG